MRPLRRIGVTKRSNQRTGISLSGSAVLLVLSILSAIATGAGPVWGQTSTELAAVSMLTGRVSVERSGELWALNPGQTVEPGQVIVTGSDGYAQLSLPDGSVLEVFPNSRFIYRANRFSLRDLIDLYIGKVRLQIHHLTNGEAPLRVTSPTAVISVRGTVFDVEVDPTEGTLVSVQDGTVSIRHRLLPGREVFVESGQSLRVEPGVPLASNSKAKIQMRTVGRIVRIAGDTVAEVRAIRAAGKSAKRGGSSPSGNGGGGSPGVSEPPSGDSGSNEPAPPPTDSSGGNRSGSPSAPPGDVVP